MKHLRLSLLGPNTIIQAARSLLFTRVLRCHTISPEGKGRNIISSNSVAIMYVSDCWLENKNVHWLLNPGHLPTPALHKRLSLIFLRRKFSHRSPIPIFNTIIYTVCIVGGRWGAHSYLALPEDYTIDLKIGLLSLC